MGGIKVGDNLTIAGDGKLSATVPTVSLSALGITATATELNYVDGVTSNIQTQLNGKVAKESGKGLSTNDYTTDEKNKLSGLENYSLPIASNSTLGGIKVGTGLTIDGNGKLSATGVEVDLSNYYTKSEVDSEISNNKATLSSSGITATATELNKLDGVTATTTELNYVDGVTSNIQTQLNGKLATNGSGASLTSLNASNISSGTINASRLPFIAASKISSGTFAGAVYANATSAANVGTSQMRNIQAGTSEPTAGSTALTTGVIWLVYE